VLRVGGITSDRSYLRLALPEILPTCPDLPVGSCPGIAPAAVTLNRVELILDPLPVTQGFRPLGSFNLSVRRVLEPELGERAILGPLISRDSLPIGGFTSAGGAAVVLNVTAAVANAIATGSPDVNLMLLVEPEVSGFGYAWFAQNPRLRFVYTMHQRPQLP
jgi:hypothetical protein